MPRALAIVCAVALVWACDDSRPITAPEDTDRSSSVVVAIARAPSSGALFAEDPGGHLGDAVAGIRVTVVRVEVRPADGGPWLGLDVATGGEIDLLDLPTDDGPQPLTLAQGELEPGEYVAARLFVEDPTIELSRRICVGNDQPTGMDSATPPDRCLDEGTHPLVIPSADRTGIKTDARFTVPADGVDDEDGTTLVLVFDAGASIRNVTFAPGRGVLMAPVLRGRTSEDTETEEPTKG